MPRLYPFLLAAAAILASASLALAQFGGAPIMPSDGFRKSPPPPAAPPPAPTRPVLARPGTTSTSAVLTPKLAVVWDSPDPTYDEGTIDRLAAALRLYTAIEAGGGWSSRRTIATRSSSRKRSSSMAATLVSRP